MPKIVVRIRHHQFLWARIYQGSECFVGACHTHQSMEESHRCSQKILLLEFLSIKLSQTHLQTVIYILEVIDKYLLLLIKK